MNDKKGIIFSDVNITPNPVRPGRQFRLQVDVEYIPEWLTYPYTYPYDYTNQEDIERNSNH